MQYRRFKTTLFITLIAFASIGNGCRQPVATQDDDTGSNTDTGYDPDLFDASATDDAGPAGACPEGSLQPYLYTEYTPYFGGEEEVLVNVDLATDFCCPYCAGFSTQVDEIWTRREDFRKYVRFYFHHHYLDTLHPDAPEIHATAAAVAKQDIEQFWILHDEIYSRKNDGKEMTPEEVVAFVEANLDVDIDRFHQDRQSEETKSFIAWDKEQGRNAGVSGTPKILICGKMEDNRNELENIVDSYLEGK